MKGNIVLTIGDLHLPATHPLYLKFCQDMYVKYGCNSVVFIGDLIDWHAVSFWPKEPDCPGSGDEFTLAKNMIQVWYKAFPKARVCIGNHDERPERLAKSVGIPSLCLKTYSELWETPKWDWQYEHVIDRVTYFHGTGCGGVHPAWNQIAGKMGSVVMGHIHRAGGVKWLLTKKDRAFGMDVGCGINVKAYQFVYGKHIKFRPCLSVGVIDNGIPHHLIMPCSRCERYHKTRKIIYR